MKPFIISADDLGLSRGITDHILDAVDHGMVTSVSIIPNGEAFDYAIAEVKKRPGLRLAIHLNLIEGRATVPAQEIPLLAHADGTLRSSFPYLCKTYFLGDSKKREALQQQVQMEFVAQIERVGKSLGSHQDLNIDSHQHTHVIPFVLDALLALHPRFNFSYIRVPEEPFFLVCDGLGALKNYAGANLIKHFLLNFLSQYPRRRLKELGINSCRYFFGVLFTGNTRLAVVKKALKILRERCKGSEIAEVIFHPGGAISGEERLWQNHPGLRQYYYSPWRERERELLKTPEFKKIWNQSSP